MMLLEDSLMKDKHLDLQDNLLQNFIKISSISTKQYTLL